MGNIGKMYTDSEWVNCVLEGNCGVCARGLERSSI